MELHVCMLMEKWSHNEQMCNSVELTVGFEIIFMKTFCSKIKIHSATSTLINQLWFNTFYGGSTADFAPSTTTYMRFDNFLVTQD
jgi:hypothetical protein